MIPLPPFEPDWILAYVAFAGLLLQLFRRDDRER